MGALALATIAVPLSGFVGPESTIAAPERAVGSFSSESSWAQLPEESLTSATSVDEVAGAASRALSRASITVSECIQSESAANGGRTVVETQSIQWPMERDSYTISSVFGYRISPITGTLAMHEGVDMSASLGTPIYAPSDGTVVEVSTNTQSGVYVRIQHEDEDGTTWYSAYAHQYMEDVLVAVGDEVTVGQQIGAVGNNGWSTGPHLHFEVRDASNTAVDPQEWLEEHDAVYPGEQCLDQ